MNDKEIDCILDKFKIDYKSLSTRTQVRLREVCRRIMNSHIIINEVDIIGIEDIIIDKKKMKKSKLTFSLDFKVGHMKKTNLDVVLPRGLGDTTAEEIQRRFNIAYNDFIHSIYS